MSGVVELTLAHSPDSDDLVMWWPLVGQRGPDGRAVEGDLGRPVIDTGRYRFRLVSDEVEALSAAAQSGAGADITAVSCAAWPGMADRYAITACGGSFGEGYGPKVVVRADDGRFVEEDLSLLTREGVRIGVPGVRTTAYLTLRLMVGEVDAVPLPFEGVVPAVRAGQVDAGLLIHEAQLTFAGDGLRAVADVGAWWTQETGLPLPLGLNVIRRDLDERYGAGTVQEVARLLGASVRVARQRLEDSKAYLRLHAQGRPEWRDGALVDRYLSMYVSAMSQDMGTRGVEAIERLLDAGAVAGLVDEVASVDVVGMEGA